MTQREKAGLRGPVRKVTAVAVRFEGGGRSEIPWFESTVCYDRQGRATDQTTRNPDGGTTRMEYAWDDSGRLAETREQRNGAAGGRTVYLYDGEGRLAYELSLRADGSEGPQTRRFYAPDGSYTEEFSTDGEPLAAAVGTDSAMTGIARARASVIHSRRDGQDRPLELRFYDDAGGLLYRIVYHYNSAGLLTDIEQRTGDTALAQPSPDDEGVATLLQEFAALFSPDTALSTVRYRHDQHGRCVEAATWMGPHCIDRRTFAYNGRGDKTRERRFGPDGELRSDTAWERDYDEHGNWVRETVLSEGASSSLTRRQIDYFQA